MEARGETWRPICRAPGKLTRPVRIDPSGVAGPTPGQSRGPRWRKTSHGFYVPSSVSDDVAEQRILEQSVRLPPHGAVTGWAACRLHGAAFFDGLERDGTTHRPVPLAIGPDCLIRQDRAVRISRDRLDESEVRTVQGIACAVLARGLFDEMRWAAGAREAVVAMDMASAAELVSINTMRAYVVRHPGWRGVGQARAALDLADENSMSPNETRMRLIWVLDAELPRPLVNQPVFDARGRLLGIADLLDPVAGVVGEYDGAAHRAGRRHRRDVMREDLFRRAGLEYFKVVGLDLADVGLVVDRMLTTRARAKFQPSDERAWTLLPPEDWYDSPFDAMNLDQRLEYRAALHGDRPTIGHNS